MKFDGEFELEGVPVTHAWLALSDPYLIAEALPGCAFLVESDEKPDFEALEERTADVEEPTLLPEATPEAVAERAFEEGNTYAALMEVGVGSVKPRFETVATVIEREFPRMSVEGEGSAANSSFELSAWMELTETDDGTIVEWEAEADVFGRIAQIGSRVINPVANRLVHQFFDGVADRLREVEGDEAESTGGLGDRIRELL